jgi:hypothetical protein
MKQKIQQTNTLINLVVDNKLDVGTYCGSLYIPQRYQNFLEGNGVDCSLAKTFTGEEGTGWHNEAIFEFDAYVGKEHNSKIQQTSLKDSYKLLDILKLLNIPYEIITTSNTGLHGRLSLLLPKTLCLAKVFKHANEIDIEPLNIISKYEVFRLGQPHGQKCEAKQLRYPPGDKIWEGDCQEVTNFCMLLTHALPSNDEMHSAVNITNLNTRFIPSKFVFAERY